MKRFFFSVFYVLMAVASQAQQYAVYATPTGQIKPLPNGQVVIIPAQAGGLNNQIQWNNGTVLAGFTMSGDGTLVPSTGVFTIGNQVVTNQKLAQMPAFTFKANNGAGFNYPSDLTATETKSLLAISTSDVSGLGTMAVQNSANVVITGGAMSGVSISNGIVNGASVVGLPAPVNPNDAARLIDLNNVSAGITQRAGVQIATTTNLSLTGEQTIDGVLTSTSRILVKNQTLSQNNGIYVTSGGAWSRASDSNTAAQLKVGYYYFVSSGTTQGATGWTIQTAPTTLGTDPVVFSQFSASSSYTNGTGIGLAGNVFSNSGVISATGTANEIAVSASTGAVAFALPASLTFTGKTITGGTFASGGFNGTLGATTPSTIAGTSGVFSGQITSTVTTGSAPFIVASSTQVNNLNAGLLNGSTWVSPGSIGSTTRNTVAATTGNFNGQITSSVSTGTAPLVIASATNVLNLNSSLLNGATFAAPGAIGGTTPGSVAGTTFSSSSNANIITTKNNFHSVVNVKDYGAIGDGSTDDTASINSAVAAMTNYSKLYFPGGPNAKYRITAGITAFASLNHIIVYGDGSEIYVDSGTSGSNCLVFNKTCDSVEVKGLRFTGTASTRSFGCHIRLAASNSSIHNNWFSGCAEFSVLVSADDNATRISNVTVLDNWFGHSLGDGLHVGSATDVTVVGNTFNGTGDDAIGLIADYLNLGPVRVLVAGNHIYNAGVGGSGCGIRVDEGTDITVSTNDINATNEAGIRLDRVTSSDMVYNLRVHVTNNTLYNTGTNGAQLGAITAYFCKEATIQFNRIYEPVSGSGIVVMDFDNMTISENVLRGCPSRGIMTNDSITANVATNWYSLMICHNDLQYIVANQGIYVFPASGITINNFMVTNNNGNTLPAGDWIDYGRCAIGKVGNNTALGGNAVVNLGSSTSVTTFNNN